jgi:uncharacterized protein
MMSEILKTLFWKSEEEKSLEHFSLRKEEAHYHLEGTVFRTYSVPTRIDYKIITFLNWHTYRIEVTVSGATYKNLRIEVTPRQGWFAKHGMFEAFTGLIDVDLGITPSTNTLPINRLNLNIGNQTELTAVWIQFPKLTMKPLAQRYTRLSKNIYRYENADGSFAADLTVDDLGIVKSYGEIWTRASTF